MLSGNNEKRMRLGRDPERLFWCLMDYPDRILVSLDNALRTVTGAVHAARPNPAGASCAETLSSVDKQLSGALMRVNHVGEVCAQALYQAQALTARTEGLREQMQEAAREEIDHLAWTQQRLDELGDRPSLLNPLWYAGAFGIGLLAGRLGDRVSLGFVIETERQVEQHLASHMDRLPADDQRSRAIVSVMKDDELRHAEKAAAAGGMTLPSPVSTLMRAAARVMTTVAHRV
jgi:ubiquinone biosynthesis monooxygenase Coq7